MGGRRFFADGPHRLTPLRKLKDVSIGRAPSALVAPRLNKGEDYRVGEVMKTLIFVGFLVLAGCTTNSPRQAAQPLPNPFESNYDAERLSKTGRQTPGGALEEVDPSITVSRGGHN